MINMAIPSKIVPTKRLLITLLRYIWATEASADKAIDTEEHVVISVEVGSIPFHGVVELWNGIWGRGMEYSNSMELLLVRSSY